MKFRTERERIEELPGPVGPHTRRRLLAAKERRTVLLARAELLVNWAFRRARGQ